MITISLPSLEGIITVIGFTPDELRNLANGTAVIEPVDFRAHFEEGFPLPSILQIVMVEKNDDLATRIETLFPGATDRIVTLKKPRNDEEE